MNSERHDRSILARWLCAGALVMATLMLAGCQPAQIGASVEVSNSECRQWDEAFLWIFNISMVIAVAAPLLATPFLGLLGRSFWLFARPYRRIVVVSAVLTVLLVLAVPLGPWTVGLNWGWLSNIAPNYFACRDQAFGARGIFGLVAPGQAALAQVHWMCGFIVLAGVLGCGLSIGLQSLLSRFGIRRKLGEETNT